MKILREDCLREILLQNYNKKITIVSAFISGIESDIKQLLDQHNQVELIIGTINAFSSIDLIDFCIEEAEENNNFKFYIDFRYDDSVHWKLYMIEPDITIIGSANFTQKGLKLVRDTCLYIHNKKLYLDYLKEIAEVKVLDKVLDCKDKNFNDELEKYRKKHLKSRVWLNSNSTDSSLEDYLKKEIPPELPILIWDRYMDEEEMKYIEAKVGKENSCEQLNFDKHECFKIDREYEKDYRENEIILCMNKRGNKIKFFCCQKIVVDKSKGNMYLIDFLKKRSEGPFKLTKEIKSRLKEKALEWSKDETDKVKLSYADLKELLQNQ